MVFDFGYRLRELREQKNMTQVQVAKRLNLSKATISGYENNIKTPSLEVLKHLAILFEVPTDYLLGFENRKMLIIEGLTEHQQEILIKLIYEFKKNKS
ncbi:DNA-binding XRE family transcriptional regulator [Hydrogenoanaerobacterium saccharovorans]|uniref:DNA-binding transcriptional regulator, XRE-family HTH domain n=1 Tax=Hydrogenoanaerobacterium saccharovorans TaxID=474960 RepID=A0A1H8AFF7_9FIRM|nr:helix-turn-helix transcriptional regulator [Hydrogenoanaerobacterium saccharovorans]RPF48030.1 DNA-binding XRE family transcriptional regulator [Hydrogenoanaerobacterium saccharovorans]SEM68267.1 DNA-binding transcriptional regulator, XRE-family HTH domain [Hydrogenoanaerobacterium saccharovorans]